jgi:hypothetical protein
MKIKHHQNTIAALSLLFFMAHKVVGKTIEEAREAFLKSDLSARWQDMTVGELWELSELGYK